MIVPDFLLEIPDVGEAAAPGLGVTSVLINSTTLSRHDVFAQWPIFTTNKTAVVNQGGGSLSLSPRRGALGETLGKNHWSSKPLLGCQDN